MFSNETSPLVQIHTAIWILKRVQSPEKLTMQGGKLRQKLSSLINPSQSKEKRVAAPHCSTRYYISNTHMYIYTRTYLCRFFSFRKNLTAIRIHKYAYVLFKCVTRKIRGWKERLFSSNPPPPLSCQNKKKTIPVWQMSK